jgi:hypothetical protein
MESYVRHPDFGTQSCRQLLEAVFHCTMPIAIASEITASVNAKKIFDTKV